MIILFCVAIWLSSGFIAAGFCVASYGNSLTNTHKCALWMVVVFAGTNSLILSVYHKDYKHGWRKWW